MSVSSPDILSVPLVDLRAGYLPIREKLLSAFDGILSDMRLFLGPQNQAFEQEFASYCQVEHGISVASGTAALHAALKACRIGLGDEVIAPSHTFFATIESIVNVGATPVMVDVEPGSLTIDTNEVRAAVTPRTKAILPVHVYGQSADMDPILDLAHDRDLYVIEDASQAHGATYKGRKCGSMGDLGCFSFYFTKNLGAFGEGGFVATSSGELAERVRMLRHHGHASKFEHAAVGDNLRMDELQAAVLRLKLPRLDEFNGARCRVAEQYSARFKGRGIELLSIRPDGDSVHHLYPVRLNDRDGLCDHLTLRGIGTGIHYKIPAHQQSAMKHVRHRCHPMPVTESVCPRLLSLPMFPELTQEQIDYVSEQVLTYVDRSSSHGP